MHASDDMQLLQEYAASRSEAAFTALVSRHINLVYSAAMRSVNNPHQAQDITQSVFVILARKSRALRRGTVLSGWLYQTARLTAANFVRTEMRRQFREHQALTQSTMNAPEPEAWARVGPLLDEAMSHLNEKDRNAIVLRFFEGKPLKEVGDALGATEDAAKMRVNRALDKLRDFFHRRGITVPAAALAEAISGNSIQAAPAGLAASVAAGAVQGSALTVSTLSFMKGAIQIMTSTKISVAIGVGAAAIIGLQWQQISTQKQTVKQLEAQVSQLSQQAQASQARQAEIEKLQEQNTIYARRMSGMEHDVAKARARSSAALAAKQPPAAGTKGNAFAEMFKDPDMLEAMRPQQLMTAKMMYGPLVKQLNLSPEQADKFYGIIVDNGIKSMKAMQSGNVSPDAGKSMETDLQSLLGDAGFAQYTDYVKNDMAGQSALMAIKNDFVDNPLSDTQQQQLLQAMKTARQSVTASNPMDLSQANPSDKTAMMDQAMQQQMQQQEQINQNVLQQAAAFLSPDQLQTLATSQSNMITMTKAMGPMMQKMFSNAPSGQ
jgi:RNA polymerase sigma factor (sigma-70 family)